jgi:hypothetical protein
MELVMRHALLSCLVALPLSACLIVTDDGADENADTSGVEATAEGTGSEGTSSVGETSVGETSVGETSVGETSVGETSVGETSVGETSGGETTGGETTGGETSGGETTEGGTLTWYSSCGDPVCQGYGGPWEGVPPCGDIAEGDPCSMEGAECDFMSDCNAVMVCATMDPKMQEGGCPISRAAFKQDIEYLDAAGRDAFYREVLDMRLATWRYRDRSDAKPSLGVILEDGEDRIWADGANDRVDLYSYGSLALVGVQAQADELAELRAAVAALQSEVVELREQAARCK